MSAKDKPISKPMNKQFEDNYDRIFSSTPNGEDTRPKDRVKQGISPSTSIEDWPESTPKTEETKQSQRIILNINGQYISLDPTDTITIKYESTGETQYELNMEA